MSEPPLHPSDPRAMNAQSTVEVRDLWYAYPPIGSRPVPEGISLRDLLKPATMPEPEAEWVLRGVDFELKQGEFVCLLGSSGAGKSTLALAMNGSVPQSTGGRIRGQVTVDGLDTKRVPVGELAQRVGVTFQNPETQFTQTTVEAEVAYGLENLGTPPKLIRERVDWALERVRMSSLHRRSPSRLSGGEKQRVGIAALMAMAQPIMVLDEPTASLDPLGTFEVFEAIHRLKGEHTILMVTQDSEQAAEFADRVLVMDRGQIVMAGPPMEVFRRVDDLLALGVRPPQVSELAQCLNYRLGHEAFRFIHLEDALQKLQRVPSK